MEQEIIIKLSQLSRGAGCGCKIAPAVLEEILKQEGIKTVYPDLLVGNESRDDAAVYNIGSDQGLISTTDFFMPIVDDPFDFGRIAATNAISDVYAMGGKPLMALAILGWPVEKVPAEMAAKVLEGARSVCKEAGIPLAGGHSIDSTEPIFGLSVNGLINIQNIKKNNTAKAGDLLFLTKPIGTGIFGTAIKRNILLEADYEKLINVTTELNKIGEELGKHSFVTAMTDVTGFGLLGHLLEMTENNNLSAEINYNAIPLIDGIEHYTNQFCFPDNTYRNWNSFESKVEGIQSTSFITLSDPQTSGGLLVAIDPSAIEEYRSIAKQYGLDERFSKPIGKITSRGEKIIKVIE